MYEGKNIHYSQVDNKPLCSSSRKICRQRRLNGYAFCVRHILEDPSAPFKSCEFITRSKLPCSNPIPKDDSRRFCSSHLQHLGQAPVNSKAAKTRDRKASPAATKMSAPGTPSSVPGTPTTPDSAAAAYMYDSRMKLADRLKSKFNLQRENGPQEEGDPEDPYAFPEPQHPPIDPTTRVISPPRAAHKTPGILSKGPPNVVVSRPLSVSDNITHSSMSVHSPTMGYSPVTASGLSLKIQPGIKETLGLKESPQPALDVQQTGLGQNSPGRSSSFCETTLNVNQSEAPILSQVGVLASQNSVSSLESRFGGTMREKHSDSMTAARDAAVVSNSSDKMNRPPGKRPGSSTPIAQLYPELAEKLERTRTKPEVKLKGDGKPKSAQKNSRTMNRLQTKIAQNKIKDKLKKNEKGGPSLAMSLPNALTKEVAPNVTITPEMSALQAQLLSALPPRHSRSSESKFPFTSMGNMAPLMHKFSSERDAKSVSSWQSHRQSPDDKGRALPPPYPYPRGVVPNPDVSTAAASLAAAAVAAAAKSAAQASKAGAVHPRGVSPQSAVPGSAASATSTKDSCASTHTAPAASTSHPMLGLPPPHPAPHLMGFFTPELLGTRQTPHTFAARKVTARHKRRRELSEGEARRKLRRKSAVNLFTYHASHRKERKDIVPLGVHSSSDDSDMDEELPWQRTWFTVSSDDDNSDDDDEEDLAVYTRTAKLSLLRSRLRRRFNQLRKARRLNQRCRTFQDGATRALLAAASRCPSAACDAVLASRGLPLKAHRADDASQSDRRCKCKVEPESSPCANAALPRTNHCVAHIMNNMEQHLFDYCTAKFSDNTQCCVPVFDIRHELPLCPEHAAKADNYNKCDLKPKKPRKKTKPSALTRPPKKGKKKKNQKKSVRPQKPILDESSHSQSELTLSLESFGQSLTDKKEELAETSASQSTTEPPTTSRRHQTRSTNRVNAVASQLTANSQKQTQDKETPVASNSNRHRSVSVDPMLAPPRSGVRLETGDVMMTSRGDRRDVISPPPDMRELVNDITKSLDTPADELDHPLLPAEIGSSLLPGLDDADQTKFLDEHELSEVLNKLPEEAFDIFSGLAGEGKNGDFRQETEAFERALAEVSRHEKATAASMTPVEAAYMSEPDEGDELTKQIADSILNSQHLDDGDDNLDVGMPDDLNDQNLSDLASSISAHDLSSMSQALTVSVLNSALDNNSSASGSGTGGTRSIAAVAGAHGALGVRVSSALANQALPTARQNLQGNVVDLAMQVQAGVRAGQPLAFPMLQGQLMQGRVGDVRTAAAMQQSAPLSSVRQQRPTNHMVAALPGAMLMPGPPNAVLQGSALHVMSGNSDSTTALSSRPQGITTSAALAPRVQTAGVRGAPASAGIVHNLLQSPPLVAAPTVHPHRPNILQSSRSITNHTQSFQIQGQTIQAQEPQLTGPGQVPNKLQQQGNVDRLVSKADKHAASAIKAQLSQGPVAPAQPAQNQLQIQMPSAIAALGGNAFAVNPQATPTSPLGPKSPANNTQQLAGQLFSPLPSVSTHGAVPMLMPPPQLLPGQINGSLLSVTEQLKQLVAQSPVAVTSAMNNKKRGSRTRRANSRNTATSPSALHVQNHSDATAKHSHLTTTTTLPLLTANLSEGGGVGLPTAGLKLALPLEALLPSDVSSVLTTVNGTTTQESSTAAATSLPPAATPLNAKRTAPPTSLQNQTPQTSA